MSGGREEVIAALDIGSSKVVCFIGRYDMDGGIQVEGIGHQVADGMHAGTVADLDAVEASVSAAVDAAERMAGHTVRRCVVNVSGGAPESHAVAVEVAIAGHQVGDADIRRALDEGARRCEMIEHEVLHAIPVGFAIDGTHGIRAPKGMFGERLGVDLHVITANVAPWRNLELCLQRCHLGVTDRVVAPYASALSCLAEDERQMGVTVIDMGGGTTSIAVFMEGGLMFADVLPVGGAHVTKDIARGLLTPLKEAERMKTLFGSALRSPSDDREMLTVPQLGEVDVETTNTIPRSALTGIINPRIEETFELVHDRLISSGFDKAAGKRVVLTGGASQLQGVREIASRTLHKQVRMGRPLNIGGLAEATSGPAFSTCAGLLAYAAQGPAIKQEIKSVTMPAASASPVTRVGRWLRENF